MAYTISRHAQERYAQRLMGKDCKADINVYISTYIQKITEDLNKMVEYGDLVYEGRATNKDYNNAVIRIYMKDTWVVLLDPARNNIITVFTIDLGCGDEMNDLYVSKLREKLAETKADYEEKCGEIDARKSEYEQLIEENQKMIDYYRSINNSLEEQNESYRTIIKNLESNKLLAETAVREVVGTLTSRPIF